MRSSLNYYLSLRYLVTSQLVICSLFLAFKPDDALLFHGFETELYDSSGWPTCLS